MPQLHPARLKEPFRFPQATADQFDGALLKAVRDNEQSMKELHLAVTDCVVVLRAEGMMCEAALLTMKAYTRHTANVQRGTSSDGSVWAMDLLLEEIVRWSIREYYQKG